MLRVRELSAASANVFVTSHARTRMRQRGITLVEVLAVLRSGRVVEAPAPDMRGNWKATMSRVVAGREIGVAVAIEAGIVVITVF